MKKVTAFVGSGHKRLTHNAVRRFLDDLESFEDSARPSPASSQRLARFRLLLSRPPEPSQEDGRQILRLGPGPEDAQEESYLTVASARASTIPEDRAASP